mgnify:CR=1 FL=1
MVGWLIRLRALRLDRDVFYVADPISSIAFVCSRN